MIIYRSLSRIKFLMITIMICLVFMVWLTMIILSLMRHKVKQPQITHSGQMQTQRLQKKSKASFLKMQPIKELNWYQRFQIILEILELRMEQESFYLTMISILTILMTIPQQFGKILKGRQMMMIFLTQLIMKQRSQKKINPRKKKILLSLILKIGCHQAQSNLTEML